MVDVDVWNLLMVPTPFAQTTFSIKAFIIVSVVALAENPELNKLKKN